VEKAFLRPTLIPSPVGRGCAEDLVKPAAFLVVKNDGVLERGPKFGIQIFFVNTKGVPKVSMKVARLG